MATVRYNMFEAGSNMGMVVSVRALRMGGWRRGGPASGLGITWGRFGVNFGVLNNI